jgi:hypothetical protein
MRANELSCRRTTDTTCAMKLPRPPRSWDFLNLAPATAGLAASFRRKASSTRSLSRFFSPCPLLLRQTGEAEVFCQEFLRSTRVTITQKRLQAKSFERHELLSTPARPHLRKPTKFHTACESAEQPHLSRLEELGSDKIGHSGLMLVIRHGAGMFEAELSFEWEPVRGGRHTPAEHLCTMRCAGRSFPPKQKSDRSTFSRSRPPGWLFAGTPGRDLAELGSRCSESSRGSPGAAEREPG